MPLVLIWKTGNGYLSKPEGTLQQEIWTPLKMLPYQQAPFKDINW